jgi:hypothetical protein
MDNLAQKQGNFSNKINLSDDFVEYHAVTEKDKVDAFIPYESISNDKVMFEAGQRWKAITGGIIVGFAVLTMLGTEGKAIFPLWILIPGIGLLFEFYRNKKKLISLSCEKYNLLLLDNQEGHLFLDKVFEKRNSYLRNKYAYINWENDMTTELNRFQFLKNLGVLSEGQFDDLKNKVISK